MLANVWFDRAPERGWSPVSRWGKRKEQEEEKRPEREKKNGEAEGRLGREEVEVSTKG